MGDNADRISISIVGGRALVFDVEDCRKLREKHGLVGVLSGTLPLAPQQNMLLGLPLVLSVEEVLYLVGQEAALLVSPKPSIGEYFEKSDSGSRNDLAIRYEEDVRQQQLERKQIYEAKLESSGIFKNKRPVATDDLQFVETPDNDGKFFTEYRDLISSLSDKVQKELLKVYINGTKRDAEELFRSYKVFKHLKTQGHYILPGMRFGGRFISYPGDPLRYHSHLIVNTRDYYKDDIGVGDLASGGRLATGVKKLWLVSGEKIVEGKEETETVCFSIEWSGFG